MQDYLSANGQTAPTITTVFTTVTLQVTEGLWNMLEVLFAATWWIGRGAMLYRQHKAVSIITVLTGIAALLDSFGNVFKSNAIADTGLTIYLVLGVIWPFVIAFYIMKRTVPQPSLNSIHQSRVTSQPLSV